MKHLTLIIAIISVSLMSLSCGGEKHFITDSSQRADVRDDLDNKMLAFADDAPFSIFDDADDIYYLEEY